MASLSLSEVRSLIAEQTRYARIWQEMGYPKVAMEHAECVRDLFAMRHDNKILGIAVEAEKEFHGLNSVAVLNDSGDFDIPESETEEDIIPDIPPGFAHSDVWDLESGTRE